MKSLLVAAALFALTPTLVLADALPACPEGQHLVENPVEEGAMHHAGGECVEDEGGGGCAIGVGRSSSPAILGAALGLWWIRRRA